MSAERGEKEREQGLNWNRAFRGLWLLKLAFSSALSTQTAALLLLAGCAIPQVPSRVIYEDPVNFVRLEPDPYVLPEWPPSARSHPAYLDANLLERILTGLQVQERRIVIQKKLLGLAPREPAFRDEELKLLVPKLAEALAQAKWNERVTFYLSRPETSIIRGCGWVPRRSFSASWAHTRTVWVPAGVVIWAVSVALGCVGSKKQT